ncbi:hypothetical protein ACN47E_004075 [Coniothyrium glycines]
MDFSSSAFRLATPPSKVSNDTISHTNLVMSCRWGWTSAPDASSVSAQPPATQHAPASTFNNVRTKRFAPCQGRLYHQLLCSHRVRTDLVEDCGSNCVEPLGDAQAPGFVCTECIQAEASRIWESRQEAHNAQYPPIGQMFGEQYDQWCAEHRQLEAEFQRDHKLYELELKAKLRPSNVCSALEATKEEAEFAAEIDSLSLSLMASHTSGSQQTHTQHRTRVSLPSDASEQLHWNLNSLALDRGACGVEYSSASPSSQMPANQRLEADELWRKPRDR